mgnify:CR=1 FL=1
MSSNHLKYQQIIFRFTTNSTILFFNQLSPEEQVSYEKTLFRFFEKKEQLLVFSLDLFIKCILFDIFTEINNIEWTVLVDMVMKSIKIYLSYQVFEDISNSDNFQSDVEEKLWRSLQEYGLFCDNNDYSRISDEFLSTSNMIAIKLNLSSFKNPLDKLLEIKKYKNWLYMEEMKILFEPFFPTAKSFETFFKKYFSRITIEVKEKQFRFIVTNSKLMSNFYTLNNDRRVYEAAVFKIKAFV